MPTISLEKSLLNEMSHIMGNEDLQKVLEHLGYTGVVPAEYLPHPLKGQYKKCMECHIEDDFLLIWKDPEQNVICLVRLGSHSKLFDKQKKRK